MTVHVEILGLFVDPESGSSIVLLGEQNEVTHVLPIFIGGAEATAIAVAMQGIAPPRPLTHDLLIDVLTMMDSRLDRVTVTGLEDGTFLAELTIETPTGTQQLSSRPSDGIALAVRVDAPVHVAQAVLDEAAVEVERDADQPFADEEIEEIVSEFQKYLTTATPSDFAEPETEPDDDPPD